MSNQNDVIQNVSDTALWVAAFRAKETERPDALFRDPFASLLTGQRGQAIARAMPYPRIVEWIMAVRTVAIDRLILNALAENVDTVVNLGAGLDTRPYRMALPKTLRWIEIDFPHMIALKEEKLSREKPACELRRIPLDLSDRAAAARAYENIGSLSGSALILTEGVIPYLTNEQAGNLADDLRSVRTFRYWIQDYRNNHVGWRKRLQKKLRNAPFKFNHPDPLRLFKEHGWDVKENILALEEGERLGRPFPFPFPWNLLLRFLPKKKLEEFKKSFGYALFARRGANERADP